MEPKPYTTPLDTPAASSGGAEHPRGKGTTETLRMEPWSDFDLHPSLLSSLQALGFYQPTPIQRRSLNAALLQHKDVVGIAETGSGKTLAYGLPILHQLLQDKQGNDLPNQKELAARLRCLILTPTRELALQVAEHLLAVAQRTTIRVVTVIGGLAPQKQQRLLRQHPEVIVATPGRLWELISLGNSFIQALWQLEYLVIDEADRMVETGHFQELAAILGLANQVPPVGESMPKQPRQTFIFSATLAIDPKGRESVNKKKKGATRPPSMNALAKVKKLAQFRRQRELIDLTTERIVVASLEETAIHCLAEEKDYYLYYILLRHPGRVLVFVNSIACIRRILPLLSALRVPAWGLHASMQQRQRLRNLERFKLAEQSVLIATDVAARGLDIPLIDHVVHYQLPRTTELYIHRSGRTARASASGVSVLLIGPEDMISYRKIVNVLRKGIELPAFEVDRNYLSPIAKRLNLARKLDSQLHYLKKHKSQKDWIIRSAREMDIEIDDDLLSSEDEEKQEALNSRERQAAATKAQLDALLNEPLVPKGGFTTFFSRRLLAEDTPGDKPGPTKKKWTRKK